MATYSTWLYERHVSREGLLSLDLGRYLTAGISVFKLGPAGLSITIQQANSRRLLLGVEQCVALQESLLSMGRLHVREIQGCAINRKV